MKQHPVPQNIASYQFRLIGEMTLKQFLELAAGLVIAYLFFNLNVPSFIKWPVIVISAFSGFALAFLPIQGRPLDRWIINFVKSVYSPTRYLWKKNNQLPIYLQKGVSPVSLVQANKPAPRKKDKQVLREYLATLQPTVSSTVFDQNEKKQLENINSLWQNTNAPQAAVITTKPESDQIKPQVSVSQPETIKTTAPSLKPVSHPTGPKPIIEPAPPLAPPMAVESAFKVKQNIKPEIAAQFSPNLAIPRPPDVPNAVVGVVLSGANRILPNSLIEIIDSQGNTLRALKTNKLGQFFTAAQLDNGSYKIKVEHDEHQFGTVDLNIRGKIIAPIIIKAQA